MMKGFTTESIIMKLRNQIQLGWHPKASTIMCF